MKWTKERRWILGALLGLLVLRTMLALSGLRAGVEACQILIDGAPGWVRRYAKRSLSRSRKQIRASTGRLR